MNRLTLLLFLSTSWIAPFVAAQAPAKTMLEREIETHAKAVQDMDKKLQTAFENAVKVVRLQAGMNPQKRQMFVDAMENEKSLFLRNGTLPFSPKMRSSTQTYLREHQAASARLAKAFDAEIATAMRKPDNAAASQLADQKSELCRKKVSAWQCKGINFRHDWSWILFSDGSTNSATAKWNLNASGVVLNNKAPGAPPNGHVDKWEIADDGMSFGAKNQQGAIHKGTRME